MFKPRPKSAQDLIDNYVLFRTWKKVASPYAPLLRTGQVWGWVATYRAFEKEAIRQSPRIVADLPQDVLGRIDHLMAQGVQPEQIVCCGIKVLLGTPEEVADGLLDGARYGIDPSQLAAQDTAIFRERVRMAGILEVGALAYEACQSRAHATGESPLDLLNGHRLVAELIGDTLGVALYTRREWRQVINARRNAA